MNIEFCAYWAKNQQKLSFCCRFGKRISQSSCTWKNGHYSLSCFCQELFSSKSCCYFRVSPFWLKNAGYWTLCTLYVGGWRNKKLSFCYRFWNRNLSKLLHRKNVNASSNSSCLNMLSSDDRSFFSQNSSIFARKTFLPKFKFLKN